MSTKLSMLIGSLGLLFLGCAKNQSATRSSTPDLIAQAKTYFEKKMALETMPRNTENYRAIQPRSPQWDSAIVVHFTSGDAVIVPVSYHNNLLVSTKTAPGFAYRLSDLTCIVFARDSNNSLQGTVITYIPDSGNTQQSSSGLYFMEDWQGNSLYKPTHVGPPGNQPSKEAAYVQNIQVCDEIDGYNYSLNDPSSGFAWTETSCHTYQLPQGRSSGTPPPFDLPSLPISRYLPPLEVIIEPPTAPIADIAAYFKCFTNSTAIDHTYSVTVCVSQPVPGTRQAWTLTPGGPVGSASAGNPVNVGHTFLVLAENSAGSIIVRNVGFYPQSSVNPAYPSDQGQLDNNELTGYNISMTYSVTSQEFFSILSYLSIGNNPGYLYDLSSNNCTTFALHALGAGDINLPSQQGSWPGGSGYDPGDLGEDIRSMVVPPKASRGTVSSPHPNQGNCN